MKGMYIIQPETNKITTDRKAQLAPPKEVGKRGALISVISIPYVGVFFHFSEKKTNFDNIQ